MPGCHGSAFKRLERRRYRLRLQVLLLGSEKPTYGFHIAMLFALNYITSRRNQVRPINSALSHKLYPDYFL